jgi:ribosome-associated translation inhibitor RaiA
MEIYVHTDHNLDGHVAMAAHVEREIAAALERLSDHVTRIEVHFAEESAGRSTGENIRCIVEARPAGQSPVMVTHHGDTLDQALRGALHKLTRLLRRDEGRLSDQNGRASIRGRG